MNIAIPNSKVTQRNLVIQTGSRVEGGSLILDDGEANYVKRFAPAIMDGNDTMDALYEVQKGEVENLNLEARGVINNCYIISSDITAIRRWEGLLELTSDSKVDTNVRKDLIITKLTFKPPYTRHNFQQILETIWGKGNFVFQVYPNEFLIIIDIHTNYPDVYLKFQDYVRDIVPANMDLVFAVHYNHIYLNRFFKYNELEDMTYGELSQYARG